MGRKRGFLALEVGICVGCRSNFDSGKPYEPCDIVKLMEESAKKRQTRRHNSCCRRLSVTQANLLKKCSSKLNPKSGCQFLGYAQRGGSPTARSRLLASLFAEKAVELICQGKGNMAVGLQNGAIVEVELEKAAKDRKAD